MPLIKGTQIPVSNSLIKDNQIFFMSQFIIKLVWIGKTLPGFFHPAIHNKIENNFFLLNAKEIIVVEFCGTSNCFSLDILKFKMFEL